MAWAMLSDLMGGHDCFMEAKNRFGDATLVKALALDIIVEQAKRNAGYRVTVLALADATLGWDPRVAAEAFDQAVAVGLLTPDETEPGVWWLVEDKKFVKIPGPRRAKGSNKKKEA